MAAGAATTLRVGAKLHIGVVVAEIPAGQPLLPGRNYSYDVAFGPIPAGFDARGAAQTLPPGAVAPTADLRSLSGARTGPWAVTSGFRPRVHTR